jgi:hypothetical protein
MSRRLSQPVDRAKEALNSAATHPSPISCIGVDHNVLPTNTTLNLARTPCAQQIAFASAKRKTVMVNSSLGGIVYVLAVQLRFSAVRFGRDSVWYTGINGR